MLQARHRTVVIQGAHSINSGDSDLTIRNTTTPQYPE